MGKELPAQVISALESGRKIQAIKRLRKSQGIDLKQAKQLVDHYLSEHPGLHELQTSHDGWSCLVWVVVFAAIATGVYYLLT